MSLRDILKIGITVLFVIAIIYVVKKWHSEAWQSNPLIPLTSIIVLAVVGGVFFVTVILPKVGDAVGTVMYSSGEEIAPVEGMKAIAKMAAGDYEGAIEEYKNMLHDKPDDVHAISEVAKIYADKLHEPDKAITYLKEQLESREWTEDSAAFLLFRLADVHSNMQDFEAARVTFEQVIGTFPDTRHSANARHKINELQEAEFKMLQSARTAEQPLEPAPDQETT